MEPRWILPGGRIGTRRIVKETGMEKEKGMERLLMTIEIVEGDDGLPQAGVVRDSSNNVVPPWGEPTGHFLGVTPLTLVKTQTNPTCCWVKTIQGWVCVNC
jgi:hypothetical protein